MASKPFLTCVTAFSALALFGCPNAEGEFERFKTDYNAIHPEGTGGGGGSSSCSEVSKAGELDGDFVFVLSASLDPKNPVLFDAKLTTTNGANGLEFNLSLQALNSCDRATKVGEVFELGPFPIGSDGAFTAKFPPLEVTGLANPISENPITAEASIAGNICAPADFICGDLSGNVTKPANIKLTKSTFTILRLASPGVYPATFKINCAEALAKDTVPTWCSK